MACKRAIQCWTCVHDMMTKVRMRWDYFPSFFSFFLLKEWFTFLDNCKIRMFIADVTLIHLGKTTAQRPEHTEEISSHLSHRLRHLHLFGLWRCETGSHSFYWWLGEGQGPLVMWSLWVLSLFCDVGKWNYRVAHTYGIDQWLYEELHCETPADIILFNDLLKCEILPRPSSIRIMIYLKVPSLK